MFGWKRVYRCMECGKIYARAIPEVCFRCGKKFGTVYRWFGIPVLPQDSGCEMVTAKRTLHGWKVREEKTTRHEENEN